MGHLLRQIVVGALALAVAGCSFVISKGPPDDYKEVGQLECSGAAAPVLDTIWAVLNGLGAIKTGSMTDREWKQQYQGVDQSTVVGVGIMWLAISGASAIYGYRNAALCEDAKEEVDEVLGEEISSNHHRRRIRHFPPKSPAQPASPTLAAPAAADPKAAGRSPPPRPSPSEPPPASEADPFQE